MAGLANWLAGVYVWIKAVHVISIIAWMAGLLYLPRLFVYHAEVTPGSEASETFKIMERRLLRTIMNPAMVAAYVFGGLMLVARGWPLWETGWIYAKLVLVAALTILHHLYALWRKDFAADCNRRSARFYKVANELPTIFMIGIVLLVIAQPF